MVVVVGGLRRGIVVVVVVVVVVVARAARAVCGRGRGRGLRRGIVVVVVVGVVVTRAAPCQSPRPQHSPALISQALENETIFHRLLDKQAGDAGALIRAEFQRRHQTISIVAQTGAREVPICPSFLSAPPSLPLRHPLP